MSKPNLTETLTSFISQITQMEKNNTKLNEDIRAIEKEKEEGYKTFNTETHILVEREKIETILSDLDYLADECSTANSDCESAQSYLEDATYKADECYDKARSLTRELERLIREEEQEETE